MAGAVLVLDVGSLGALACDALIIIRGVIDLLHPVSPTSTRGAHQDDAHLLGQGLGLLAAIDQALLQLNNLGLELADGVLQTGNDVIGNGSHFDRGEEKRGEGASKDEGCVWGWKRKSRGNGKELRLSVRGSEAGNAT